MRTPVAPQPTRDSSLVLVLLHVSSTLDCSSRDDGRFICSIPTMARVTWCPGEKARAAAQTATRLHVVSRRADALEAALLWFDAHYPGTLDPSVLRKVRRKKPCVEIHLYAEAPKRLSTDAGNPDLGSTLVHIRQVAYGRKMLQ